MGIVLWEHLTRKEVTCKCGCGYGLKDGDFSPETVEVFEDIRQEVSDRLGVDTPLIISSGCRCFNHHKKIYKRLNLPVTTKSSHLQGCALDIKCPSNMSYEDFYAICVKVVGNKGGVGKYTKDDFVHVDTRGYYARWGK